MGSVDTHGFDQTRPQFVMTFGMFQLLGLSVCLVASVLLALATGAVPISLTAILNDAASPIEQAVLVDLRAPRVILAGFVGAALGLSGAVLQGLFRNPLADPGIIGVSSGAALGAISMIVLGSALAIPASVAVFAMPIAAIVGAMAVTAFLYLFAMYFGQFSMLTVILVGIAINAMATVGIGAFQYMSDDAQLRTLVFWMMGSFGRAEWVTVTPAVCLMIFAILGLLSQAKNLDRLQLGEAEAMHLGVNVGRAKRVVILLAATAVGAGVALSGIVGFVGLVVPHLSRMILGSSHRIVLPGALLIGAALMILADLLARILVTPAELPISLVTSALGAPFFLWLIARARPR